MSDENIFGPRVEANPEVDVSFGPRIETSPLPTDMASLTDKPKVDPVIERNLIDTGNLEEAMRVSGGDIGYALSRTRQFTPDQAARIEELSKQMNLPRDTVERNTSSVEDLKLMRDAYKIITEKDSDKPDAKFKYPYTMAWIADRKKMEQAKDDVVALTQIEERLRKTSQEGEGLLKQTARSLGYTALQFAKIPSELPGFIQGAGIGYIEESILKGQAKTGLKPSKIFFDNAYTRFLDDASKAIRSVKAEGSAVQMIKEGNYADAINNIYLSAVENSANLVAMLGLSVVASPAAGLAFAGATSGSSSFAEDMKAGRDVNKAAQASVLKGGAEAAFEIVTLNNSKVLFNALGKQLVKEAGEEAANITLKGVFGKLLNDTVTEGASEYATTIAQDLADYFTGKKDALDGTQERALNSALVGGFTGGVLGGANVIAQFNTKALETRRNVENMDQVNKILDESKLLKRNPEFLKDFIDKTSTGNVYIPVNSALAYFQNDPVKAKSFAEALGITQEEFAKAEATGTDLTVDKGKFALLDKTPGFEGVYKGLRDSVKYTADGFTLGELDKVQEQLAQDIKEAKDSYKELKDNEVLPARLVEMKTKLVNEKNFSAKDADALLSVLYAGSKTFAPKFGKTIDEYLADVEIQIRPDFTPGGLEQIEDISYEDELKLIEQPYVKGLKKKELEIMQEKYKLVREPFTGEPQGWRLKDTPKVLEQGEGKIKLYHGTNADFDKFSLAYAGQTDSGFLGTAVYLTSSKKTAKVYGKKVKEVYADIKNPLVIEDPMAFGGVNPDKIKSLLGLPARAKAGEVRKELLKRGYDAVIVNEITDKGLVLNSEVAVLNPSSLEIIQKQSEGLQQKADLTNTPEFKKWFEGSKIKEGRKPKVVYHGSGVNIEEFSYDFTNQGNDQLGSGFYFTTDRSEAEGYSKARINSDVPKLGGENNPTVIEAYLSITNPLDVNKEMVISRNVIDKFISKSPIKKEALSNFGDVDYEGEFKVKQYAIDAYYDSGKQNVLKFLNSIANDFYPGAENTRRFNETVSVLLEYDGVKAEHDGKTHYVAFFPAQIKSVNNKGNFDYQDPNIYNQTDPLLDNYIKSIDLAKASEVASVDFLVTEDEALEQYLKNKDIVDDKGDTPVLTVSYNEYTKLKGDVLSLDKWVDRNGNGVNTPDFKRVEKDGVKITTEVDFSEDISEDTDLEDVSVFVNFDYELPKDFAKKQMEAQEQEYIKNNVINSTEELLASDNHKVNYYTAIKVFKEAGLNFTFTNSGWGKQAEHSNVDGISLAGTGSLYIDIYKKEDVEKEGDSLKLRFSDHSNTSADYASPDFNIVNGEGFEEMLNFVLARETGALFQSAKTPRGSIQFQDNKSIISLYETANFSTLLHETGHFFTNELKKLIDTNTASEQDVKDYNTLVEFAGGELNREGHEKIARGFEAYLREGKAPSVKLQKAFRKIKTWLMNIYRSLASLDVKINDDIRAVFDRILASEAEIIEAETLYKQKQIAQSYFANQKLTEEQKAKLEELRKEAREQALEIQVAKTMNVYFKAIGRTPFDDEDLSPNTQIASGKKLLKDQADANVADRKEYKIINEASNFGGYNEAEFRSYAGDAATEAVKAKHKDFFNKKDKAKTKTYRQFVLEESRGIKSDSLTDTQKAMVKDKGAFSVYRKDGIELDVLATNLVNEGKLVVPTDRNDADYLLEKILNNDIYEKEYVSGEGNMLDAAAIHYEYESTEALVDAIVNADNIEVAKKKEYESMLAAREAQIKAELDTSDIAFAGEESLYNEATLDYLLEEAKILAPKLSEKVSDKKVYKDAARQAVGEQKVRDAVRYDKYLAKEREVTKDMVKAINKPNQAEVQQLKEKQIRNNVLVMASIEAKARIEKILSKCHKIAKAKKGSILSDYHDVILLILNNHGIIDKGPARVDKVDPEGVFNELQFGVDPMALPEVLLNYTDKTQYKDMTVEALQDLMAGINILATRGRNTVKLNKEGKAQTIEEKVDECTSVMLGRKKVKEPTRHSPFHRITKGFRSLLAEVSHVQFDLKRVDGYTGLNLKSKNWKVGPNEEMFDIMFRKQKDAAQAFKDFNDKHMKAIGEKLSAINERLNTGSRGKEIQGVLFPGLLREAGYTGWTSEMIVAIALNVGNIGNLETLKKGYGLSDSDIKTIVGQLTIPELETIQEIWDAIDTMWVALDEAHYKQNGFRLKKVEATPFVVQAYDESGTPRFHTMRGGYYPVKHDAELSRKVASYTEKDIMKNESLAVHQRSKPRDSMTKERKGSSLPIKLSVQPLYSHVRDTINYTHMAEVLTDVYKVIRNEKYASAYSRLLGKERYDVITPWLSSIARPELATNDSVDYWLNKTQRLTAIGALGASFLSYAKQLIALVAAAKEISPMDIAYGMGKMLQHPIDSAKEVDTRSIFMKDRNSKVQIEIAKQLEKIDPFTKKVTIFGKDLTIKDLQDMALVNIRFGDLCGAYSTWIGAYNKKINAGMSEAEAVHYADKLISETQPTANALFNNLWQAGGANRTSEGRMLRWIIAPFSSWTMKYGSRMRAYYAGWQEGSISTKDYAEHVMYEAILPAMLVPPLVTAIHGGTDAEEPESYLYEFLGYQLSWAPFVNNIVPLIRYGGFGGVMEVPAAKPVKLAANVVTSAVGTIQGEKDYVEFLKALGYMTEFWAGIPAMKAAKEIDKGAKSITEMTE